MFTQERTPQQTFTYSKSRIETLKNKCETCSKLTIKTPGQLYTLLLLTLNILTPFPCILLLTWGPTLSTYKRWNNILLQLLTDVQKS